MKGAERLRTKIWRNNPCKVTLGGHLASSPHLSLLRSLFAEFQDGVDTVGQEVSLDVINFGGIDERSDSW